MVNGKVVKLRKNMETGLYSSVEDEYLYSFGLNSEDDNEDQPCVYQI